MDPQLRHEPGTGTGAVVCVSVGCWGWVVRSRGCYDTLGDAVMRTTVSNISREPRKPTEDLGIFPMYSFLFLPREEDLPF